MKRIFLYLLMAISVAVFAQQQASDEPGSSDETQAAAEQPAGTEKDSEENAPDGSGKTGEGNEELIQNEAIAENGQENEDGPFQASGDSDRDFTNFDPDDNDFDPDEEISEDYPVPLPSDI